MIVDALILLVVYLFCVLAGLTAMVVAMSWASLMEWVADR